MADLTADETLEVAVSVLVDAARVERGRAVTYTEQLAASQAPNYGDMARASECRLRAEMLEHLAGEVRARVITARYARSRS